MAPTNMANRIRGVDTERAGMVGLQPTVNSPTITPANPLITMENTVYWEWPMMRSKMPDPMAPASPA